MKIKKILSVITLITLMFAMCIPAFAAHTVDDFETEAIGDFVYEKGTNKIFGYTGGAETVELPSGCKIAAESAIINAAPSVTKVILTSGDINGANLTGLFPNLKEVEFKEGITEISDGAFNFDKTDKTIETFILPSSLKKIGRFAFVNCGAVKTFDLPDGLEELGIGAIVGCTSLTGDITIPDTVTSMGKYVFASCGSLDEVHISENAVYQKDDEYRSSTDDTADWFGAYALNDKSVRTEV
ncbi:MAG: leucine-rich repeat domain-containing protein, partial [Clostridia bacterium]|nr:leucine-rich repeat domain-containing protein [Clostridia bacterium]